MNSEKKLNILIADDEEGLRFSLASILEIEGYDVQTAGDGLEALELVKKNEFDIAFFDIRMPEMNGVEAFKRIKEISPETIVVMMTAYAMNDLIKEAVKEGAFACISKPFEIEDVLNTVKEINSKPNALIICKDSDTNDFLNASMKASGFITINKKDISASLSLIERRTPEIIFIESSENDCAELTKIAKKHGRDLNIVCVCDKALFKGQEKATDIKFIKKPVTKSSISEFIVKSSKKKVAIISSDTISSNNLKLAIVAKGYDVAYYNEAGAFFSVADVGSYNFIVCDAGDADDLEGFYGKIKTSSPGGSKIIFVFDFESSATDNLRNQNVAFLRKPFDAHELFEIMEKM
jgi:Response regulator containing CheY-like receiver, AAA-type ATPase, and DNA-binding domains